MINNKKIKESELLSAFEEGRRVILAPLQFAGMERETLRTIGRRDEQVDAVIEGALPGETECFRFVVEVKSGYTPLTVRDAMTQVKRYTQKDEYPMILVPYLSEDRLEELEAEGVSGIDLCGNGLVTVPGRLLILRTGAPNLYPDSRPLQNPFQGKSAMVARVFLRELSFSTVGGVREAVQKGGVDISLSQVSKSVQALKDALVVGGKKRSMHLLDPDRLMDQLANAWRPEIKKEIYMRLPGGLEGLTRLNNGKKMDWSLTGTASVARYAALGQSGPMDVAVSDLGRAAGLLEGRVETVPGYADVRLLETEEPGFYFDVSVADNGVRWASRLQTWIELRNGDARQQTAAREIRAQWITGGNAWKR